MAKKRFTDDELRDAKVPKDEFNDSVKQLFNAPMNLKIRRKRMSLFSLIHIVDLIKNDGQVFKNIKARIYSGGVLVHDVNLPFEVGDTITRELPNGITEEYIIDDPVYYDRGPGTNKPHYQIKVHKKLSGKNKKITPDISVKTGDIGDQARINIFTEDRSQNISQNNSNTVFTGLNETIEKSDIPEELRDILRELSKKMESTINTPSFKDHYTNFMANVASHMTVFGPLVMALAPFVTKG